MSGIIRGRTSAFKYKGECYCSIHHKLVSWFEVLTFLQWWKSLTDILELKDGCTTQSLNVLLPTVLRDYWGGCHWVVPRLDTPSTAWRAEEWDQQGLFAWEIKKHHAGESHSGETEKAHMLWSSTVSHIRGAGSRLAPQVIWLARTFYGPSERSEYNSLENEPNQLMWAGEWKLYATGWPAGESIFYRLCL